MLLILIPMLGLKIVMYQFRIIQDIQSLCITVKIMVINIIMADITILIIIASIIIHGIIHRAIENHGYIIHGISLIVLRRDLQKPMIVKK